MRLSLVVAATLLMTPFASLAQWAPQDSRLGFGGGFQLTMPSYEGYGSYSDGEAQEDYHLGFGLGVAYQMPLRRQISLRLGADIASRKIVISNESFVFDHQRYMLELVPMLQYKHSRRLSGFGGFNIATALNGDGGASAASLRVGAQVQIEEEVAIDFYYDYGLANYDELSAEDGGYSVSYSSLGAKFIYYIH